MLFYTERGRRRLLNLLEEANREESKCRIIRTDYLSGMQNLSTEDLGSEMGPYDNALACAIQRVQSLREVFGHRELVLAPEPRINDKVTIGHFVTLDSSVSRFVVEIGGFREEAETEDPPVWSYLHPPGKSLLRKSVGDSIQYNGKKHEIALIQLRSEYNTTNQAKAA
jgi:transcription elongation GreA/GreB family factor